MKIQPSPNIFYINKTTLADVLGVNRRTLNKWVVDGKIKPYSEYSPRDGKGKKYIFDVRKACKTKVYLNHCEKYKLNPFVV